MTDHVWIQCGKMGTSLFPEVAEHLGLRDGQTVDEATYLRALRLHCEMGIAICDLEIAIEEQNEEVVPIKKVG